MRGQGRRGEEDAEESSREDIRVTRRTEKRERRGEQERKDRGWCRTKANRELNSPAAVQAALVIPWEAWAEDDAAEVCHRAATLSWRETNQGERTCHVSTEMAQWENKETATWGINMEGGQRALCLGVCVSFSTGINCCLCVRKCWGVATLLCFIWSCLCWKTVKEGLFLWVWEKVKGR